MKTRHNHRDSGERFFFRFSNKLGVSREIMGVKTSNRAKRERERRERERERERERDASTGQLTVLSRQFVTR